MSGTSAGRDTGGHTVDRGWVPAVALFDLDGTLVDREPLACASLESVMADLGAPLEPGVSSRWIGRGWPDVHGDLEVAKRFSLRFEDWHARVLARSRVLVAEGWKPTLLAGGAQLIGSLHEAGVVVGIVTGSTRAELDEAVEQLDVANQLSLRVAAEDYRNGKPSPEPYLVALDALAASPQDCVVFEDSEAGVRAALDAGTVVIATSEANAAQGRPGHQCLDAAHAVVPSLTRVDAGLLATCRVRAGHL